MTEFQQTPIITALGGELRLVKGAENTGYLEAVFLRDSSPELAQRSIL